ncbi:MAG: acetylornithine deacetylase [Kordiimonadaceae bacterium]|jgi:acetylornithine deacetylase|nr:acetylornithine deacetylase [Kordiimonadaceae bacterium]MBT6035760.1 acetylornithine deacetylase [Kordiimonadaceae bacterium]MBT6328282.1 acetylornithine deacetylase [Kordiimonadaceae bacterium]MBT7583369.1 acetylornithine deacetylase [Kordiimonadaceae bacterium]
MNKMSSQELLQKLVGFDTTSSKPNMELIHFIENYLAEIGIKSTLIKDSHENKANLLAVFGPQDVPGIMLSGHTDVVPVEGQNWASEPFDMTEKGDKLYGRGTCDMKGFIACVLAKIPDFVNADLKEPIYLAFSYDEETGCTGVHSLVDVVNDIPVKPRACIVGEPTSMKVVNSHKGIRHLLTKVYGHENHSSTDRGVNAISYAAEIVIFIDDIQQEMRGRPTDVEGYDPPYATVHVGRIKGGTAANITPNYCEIEWDYRPIPGTDEDEVYNRYCQFIEGTILPKMREKSDEYGDVKTDYLAKVPCLFPETGSEAEVLVKHLAEQNSTHVVSYGTEAGIFYQKGGVPAVVCGPGSINEAHKADEYIDISQMKACERFLDRLLDIVKK